MIEIILESKENFNSISKIINNYNLIIIIEEEYEKAYDIGANIDNIYNLKLKQKMAQRIIPLLEEIILYKSSLKINSKRDVAYILNLKKSKYT
jgi:hypothetical protein